MPADEDFTVTPYEVDGAIDYQRLLDDFGADRLTNEQIENFPPPGHPLIRRRIFYAQRDIDPFLTAGRDGDPHSIVTGRGPSGPMHIGHLFPFYLAKYLQDQYDTLVYIPLSDDEKAFAREQSLGDISASTRENILDILAVGFDPARTRIVIDTADADIVYPLAAAFAREVTQATVNATYGDPDSIGLTFYPAVQAAHLLLPQLVNGPHPTLVPIAVDQDPHVRICRDIAAKKRYPVKKPGALLSKFLPSLAGPGKMSSSEETPNILLSDDQGTVHAKIQKFAYSGGQSSVEAHRKLGGDPEVDVSYLFLYYFFEEDDERVERIARDYRDGRLLSGELKRIAADAIAAFLSKHQARRTELERLDPELADYRLSEQERDRALRQVGYPGDALTRADIATIE